MPSSKRKSDIKNESDDSLSSLEDEPPAKQSKSLGNVKYETAANGDKIIDITGKKYVCVRSFRGRTFVDIREYYEDKADGALKPGKKGVSLNCDQWENLKNLIKTIDGDIQNVTK